MQFRTIEIKGYFCGLRFNPILDMKILGIGNALVDIMTSLSDEKTLATLNLPKGSMQLVNEQSMYRALDETKGFSQVLASGGSAANTINGLANLGVQTAFIGKVGDDDMGAFFRSDLEKIGITPCLLRGNAPSGRALAFVTPDSERTFATYLGSAIEMTAEELTDDMFKGYSYLHIEGYLVQNHKLVERAMELAKANGLKVSLDLASYNVVEANREFLQSMIEKYVDIIFANEEEAKAYSGRTSFESLVELSKYVDIAVVKLGEKGSIVKQGAQVYDITAVPAKSIDTTGAGDSYAAGFLYGLTKGLDLEKCGQIGSVISARVIEVMGPKMDEQRWAHVKGMIDFIEKYEQQ